MTHHATIAMKSATLTTIASANSVAQRTRRTTFGSCPTITTSTMWIGTSRALDVHVTMITVAAAKSRTIVEFVTRAWRTTTSRTSTGAKVKRDAATMSILIVWMNGCDHVASFEGRSYALCVARIGTSVLASRPVEKRSLDICLSTLPMCFASTLPAGLKTM